MPLIHAMLYNTEHNERGVEKRRGYIEQYKIAYLPFHHANFG